MGTSASVAHRPPKETALDVGLASYVTATTTLCLGFVVSLATGGIGLVAIKATVGLLLTFGLGMVSAGVVTSIVLNLAISASGLAVGALVGCITHAVVRHGQATELTKSQIHKDASAALLGSTREDPFRSVVKSVSAAPRSPLETALNVGFCSCVAATATLCLGSVVSVFTGGICLVAMKAIAGLLLPYGLGMASVCVVTSIVLSLAISASGLAIGAVVGGITYAVVRYRQARELTKPQIHQGTPAAPPDSMQEDPFRIVVRSDPAARHPFWAIRAHNGDGQTVLSASTLFESLRQFHDTCGQCVEPGVNILTGEQRAMVQGAAAKLIQDISAFSEHGVTFNQDAHCAFLEALMLAWNMLGHDSKLDIPAQILDPVAAEELLTHFQGEDFPFSNGMFIAMNPWVINSLRGLAAIGSPEAPKPSAGLNVAETGSFEVFEADGELISTNEAGFTDTGEWLTAVAAAQDGQGQNVPLTTVARGILGPALLHIEAGERIKNNSALSANLERGLDINRTSDDRTTANVDGIEIPSRWRRIILAMVKRGDGRVAEAAKDIQGALGEAGSSGDVVNIYLKRILIAFKETIAPK